MAIQQIESSEVKGTVGIQRKINKAAEGMIMDVVQIQQYTKPIPSTVRELTANAVDSQSEKEKALEILSGKCGPEKYFIKRDGELYKDSNWDPSYYDLTKLDASNNFVELIYREREGIGRCDSFIVRDYGVGVGGHRLEGMLSVGFSTKRNRKDALGAFGVGSKVGLATGADYYKVTTVYNGVKYIVQVFNKKINPLIGQYNLDKNGEENPYIEFVESNGRIYGEYTTDLNYTEIEVPCMKHHKEEFIVAVKTQLLYFPNVRFFTERESDGYKNEVHFKPSLLYNSSNLVISETSPYSKPHVVIVKGTTEENSVGVCYGYIDFKELELQDMNGNIGIKCPIRSVYEDEKTGEEIVIQEGVDVTTSRENIRWTPATREFLLNQFKIAQVEATNLVEKELKERDFLKWIEACKNITSYSGGNTAIGRLSKIVDLKSISPKFSPHPELVFKFVSETFQDFTVEKVTKIQDPKTKKFEAKREEVVSWIDFQTTCIFFREDRYKRNVDLYLADTNNGSFISIKANPVDHIETSVQSLIARNTVKFKDKDAVIEARIERQKLVISLLKASVNYKIYDDVEVPDSYWKQLEKLETGTEEEARRVPTPEERRKLEERTVANTFTKRYNAYYTADGQTYQRNKVEPKIQEIMDYKGNMFYGSVEEEPKLHLALHIMEAQEVSKRHEPNRTMFYNNEYKFLVVGKSNKQYFKQHKNINDFFGVPVDVDGGTQIMIDQALVRWNTGRILSEMLKGLEFYNNFNTFDEKRAQTYSELMHYVSTYYTPLEGYQDRFGMGKLFDNLKVYLNQLVSLQNFVEEGHTPDEIAEKVKELTMPDGINLPENTLGCLVVNSELIKRAEDLIEYAGPVKVLFNELPVLTTKGNQIGVNLTILIQEILQMKGL